MSTRTVLGRLVRIGDVLPYDSPRFVVASFEPLEHPSGRGRRGRVAVDLMGRREPLFDDALYLLPVEQS